MTEDQLKPYLVVDDEESILGILAVWLREAGFDIVTCSRYEDARQYLASQTPAGLITDVRLGAYNGLQLAMLLHDREPGLPIVVLSAFDDPTLRKETDGLGGVFLTKPLRREDLLASLRDARARHA